MLRMSIQITIGEIVLFRLWTMRRRRRRERAFHSAPAALSLRTWMSSACFAFGFVIITSVAQLIIVSLPEGAQQGAARQEREARRDVARLVRRQDEVCRVV
jgi:hypothetical protein